MNIIIILDPIFIWKLFVKTHRELRALKVRSLTEGVSGVSRDTPVGLETSGSLESF